MFLTGHPLFLNKRSIVFIPNSYHFEGSTTEKSVPIERDFSSQTRRNEIIVGAFCHFMIRTRDS